MLSSVFSLALRLLFSTLADDDGLPVPTTVYDDHWSAIGHIYLPENVYDALTPFITIGIWTIFQL